MVEDDDDWNAWRVSTALRQLLVAKHESFRHAEAAFVNFKVFTLNMVRELSPDDRSELIRQIVKTWKHHQWATTGLTTILQEFFQAVTHSPLPPGPVRSAESARLSVREEKHGNGGRDARSTLAIGGAMTMEMSRLIETLDAVASVLGEDRYKLILAAILQSENRMAESVAFAHEALQLADKVELDKEFEPDKTWLENGKEKREGPQRTVKDAKVQLRNLLMFRLIGWAMGFDNLAALENRFPSGSAQLRAQLLNAIPKIRNGFVKELTGGKEVRAVLLEGMKKPKCRKLDDAENTNNQDAHEADVQQTGSTVLDTKISDVLDPVVQERSSSSHSRPRYVVAPLSLHESRDLLAPWRVHLHFQ